ncbi:MAG: benzoate-CoA ligase family protein [Fimbriimonadaceae bacterium]|nr:benzoate-CoA ligase family protein [Alphaproteobacteria bacterium]
MNGNLISDKAPIGNVVDYLFEHSGAPAYMAKPALILDDQACTIVTYGDLHARVCQVGNYLKMLGIEPGDRAMFSVADGVDFEAIFLGGMKAGVVPIPINTWLKPENYLYYVKDSGCRVVFIDHLLVPIFEDIKDQLTDVAHIIVTGEPVEGYPFLSDKIAGLPETLETYVSEPDDTAFWLYSSGSTGDPKAVIHTHEHIYWATELFGIGAQKMDMNDVSLCPPKMFFAYGLGNQVYFPIRTGGVNLINSGLITPKKIWKLWLEHAPTIVMSVPTLFAGMLQMAKEEIGQDKVRDACRNLRFSVSGGELLPPTLLAQWEEYTGTEILDGVGTTEMLHMFMLNIPGKVVPRSCGRLVNGFTAEILDDDGNQVPQGEIGNLHAFGPTAATQYWNKPERTKEVFGRGGVLTGDKFYQDAEGNYFFVGRSDDMLRVGGIWVSPTEIEAVLAEHDAVLESAVIGHPDEQQMIKPYAYVMLKNAAESGDGMGDVLKAHVRGKLAHYKCPRWIKFVDELPKTATGKIQRFLLREPSK